MRRDFCLLLFLAVLLFGVNNTFVPPDIMESRNLVSAREMVESGDWLVPHLNGNLRLEKPPLPTWGAAVVESVAPHNLGAQRALSAFMAWLLVWFAYLMVVEWRRNRSLALTVAAILASCYSLMFMARNATWDIWAQAFCMGGIWLYVRGVLRTGRQWGNFSLAGLMLGLSFLSKGPVALYGLLLPFLLAFHAVERPSMKKKWGSVLLMALLALAVGTWWYAYIFFFVRSQAQQVIGKETAAWHNHNVRPWHYYKLFFVESGVWCLLWLTALVDGWRHRIPRSLRTALVWSVLALVLLSLMPEKKTRYLLPMMVPCALSVGFYLESLASTGFRRKADRRVLQLNVGLLVVVLFVLSGALLYLSFLRATFPIGLSIVMVTGYLFLATRLSRELLFANQRVGRIVAYLVTVMVVTCLLGFRTATDVLLNPHYKSLSLLVDSIPEKTATTYVWPKGQELRPEVMLQTRHIIRLVAPTDSAAMNHMTPFVLLFPASADSVQLPSTLCGTRLGEYDLNWSGRPQHHRRSKLLIHAWRVERKGCTEKRNN